MRHVAATMVAVGLALSACGSGDGDAGPTPPATEPPATEPPATEPPVTGPPATEPPATEPPVTEPPATEPPATEPPVTEPEPVAIEPIGTGPFDVGVQTLTIGEGTERPLTVDVWFPLAAGVDGPPQQYTLFPGNYYESPLAVSADGTAVSPEGPFPLVVYSHGSGGLRFLASYYTEAIASHGYVVAAPDHTGNSALERLTDTSDPFELIELNRPRDVTAVIDALTDPAHPSAGPYSAVVDTDRIAVTGHSFGGYTAFAVAAGMSNALGELPPDTRVDAIIPLAPASGDGIEDRLLSDEELAAIEIPALIIAGTADITTPVEPNVTRPWELLSSAALYRLELVDAQHSSFTDFCEYLEFVPELPDVLDIIVETIETFALEGCTPTDMPIGRAQELTNTFSITFLESVFRDGTMLDPATHVIPGDVNFLVR